MQEYLIAFAVGGTICALSQLLMDKTKLMPGRIMVILVVTGVVLGAFGIYEPFKEWAGAGASVPLLGFGNTLWKGVKKAVDEEGLLGIFKGGLTASSAGICAAIVFGYLSQPSKTKKINCSIYSANCISYNSVRISIRSEKITR